MKKLICILFLFIALIFAYKIKNVEKPAPEKTPPVVEYDEKAALSSITEEECKEHVYKLSSDEFEGRMSGKKGNVLAADYIKSEFERYGLPTICDKFKIKRTNPGPKNEVGDDFTQNIYAWIEGSDPILKDEIVVVGAHMDHIGYGPSMSRSPGKLEIHNGADDNASGTAALLEIAEAMSKLKPKRTIVFQAYSAEEMGLIGSRFYVDHPKFPLNNPDIKKHVAMINMDMVGYLDKGYHLAAFFDGNSSVDISKNIDELDKKYNFAKKITARGGGGSDHASFYNKKVPVAFLHTGGHKHYHTPDDDADRLNYKGLESVSRYAFELVFRLAENFEKPKFNDASFKILPYNHDHGNPDMPFYHSH
jgi:hypothetical protein